MKDTNVIVYPAGAYGTYLEWALTTLTTPRPISDPGRPNGNSHNFLGNHLSRIENWREYLTESKTFSFSRLHPKIFENDSVINNVNEISQNARRVINLYPDNDTYLLVIHNYLYKIWNNFWDGGLKYVKKDDVYNNWPVDKSVPLDQLPRWIQREYFSYNVFPSWEAQVEWFLPDSYSGNTNCQYLFVNDLLSDFAGSMARLEKFLEVTYVRPIDDLLPYHSANLSRQKHMTQQSLAEAIIDAATNQKELAWESDALTIFTEAWIQNQLRARGFELKCHDLDIFPTNSLQLHDLLYQI
jgi:hypothetical protein